MKIIFKLFLFPLLLLPVNSFSQSNKTNLQDKYSSILKYLPGSNLSIQSDTYYAQEANIAGQRLFSNNYIDASIFNKYLNLGLRFEGLTRPIPGFEAHRGRGIANIYLRSNYKSFTLDIGDFYEQFGSGLVLRSYEDRNIGTDNSIRGLKLKYQSPKGIALKLLAGQARNHFDRLVYNQNRGYLYGADIELNSNSLLKTSEKYNWTLISGISAVNKFEKEDFIIVQRDNKSYKLRQNENVMAISSRLRFLYKDFDISAEYAHKFSDPNISNDYSAKYGSAAMLSASYSKQGLSILFAARRSDNFDFRSKRSARDNDLRINFLQAFTQQHSYSLATLHPYATQPQGELALQSEIRYKFAKKSFLGGKYGSTVKFAISNIRGASPISSRGGLNELFFQDINLEFSKKINKKYSFTLNYIYQQYNQEIIEGHKEYEDKYIRSNIFVYEGKHRLNNNFSLRTEFQYLLSPDAEGDWIFALGELSLYKYCILSASQQFNIGLSKEYYYMYSITGIISSHHLQLSYGRTREGWNCSGGVCRYMPETKGLFLSYNFIF